MCRRVILLVDSDRNPIGMYLHELMLHDTSVLLGQSFIRSTTSRTSSDSLVNSSAVAVFAVILLDEGRDDERRVEDEAEFFGVASLSSRRLLFFFRVWYTMSKET
jgi:hypothetical protein